MEQAGDGLWQKLRRRKVVQWGIAYSGGAWGFLQGEYQKIAESSTIDSSTHVHRDPGFPRFLNSPASRPCSSASASRPTGASTATRRSAAQ
jgi:hypothetical protein